MKIFVDTNILLDVLLYREPFVENAAKIWSMCEKDVVEGYVSSISFNNAHYLIGRIENRLKADKAIRITLDTFRAVPLDERLIRKALDANFHDYEDAIQYFSALQSSADFIITRNVKDFPKQSDIPVLTPEDFIALELDFS
eukprot:TRINITY_DN20930_c0_g2_i1.p1 TRINITY_DN20930_c0_g2~~TRINITY_DN20930_c0_g2_i1.p1  ORF type:complete len:141 (+),score=18.65 TRINITY_DN20930_c0_g2_i1:177-599(+)